MRGYKPKEFGLYGPEEREDRAEPEGEVGSMSGGCRGPGKERRGPCAGGLEFRLGPNAKKSWAKGKSWAKKESWTGEVKEISRTVEEMEEQENLSSKNEHL